MQALSKTELLVDTTIEQLQIVHKSVCVCVCVCVCEYMGGFIEPHVNKVLFSSIHPKYVPDTFSLTPFTVCSPYSLFHITVERL